VVWGRPPHFPLDDYRFEAIEETLDPVRTRRPRRRRDHLELVEGSPAA